MSILKGVYALYFRSRKNHTDRGTWSKEKMPDDWTEQEVAEAAKAAGMEGYAIMNMNSQEIYAFKWFV